MEPRPRLRPTQNDGVGRNPQAPTVPRSVQCSCGRPVRSTRRHKAETSAAAPYVRAWPKRAKANPTIPSASPPCLRSANQSADPRSSLVNKLLICQSSARACRLWVYADLILRRPRASEGLEGCSRDRVNARSGASFEAASQRLRTRCGGGERFQANAARSSAPLTRLSTALGQDVRDRARAKHDGRGAAPLYPARARRQRRRPRGSLFFPRF